jgi:hypothetical protein
MKTNELTGAALDWAVAKCEGLEWLFEKFGIESPPGASFSTDWSQGGPIIEREGISLDQYADFPNWAASCPPESGFNWFGPTPLIAAMRCYVASKMGDEIEIPEELI